VQIRDYNFASAAYVGCLSKGIPEVNGDAMEALRSSALSYLSSFPKDEWHTSPVTSILVGKKLTNGKIPLFKRNPSPTISQTHTRKQNKCGRGRRQD
jgi:hypothetical protein